MAPEKRGIQSFFAPVAKKPKATVTLGGDDEDEDECLKEGLALHVMWRLAEGRMSARGRLWGSGIGPASNARPPASETAVQV